MDLKLYEIADALRNAIEGKYTIDEETGVIYWSPEDLEALDAAFQDKAEACAIVAKTAEANAAAVDQEIKKLQMRKKVYQQKQEHMLDYISEMMKTVGVDKIETPKVVLSFRSSEYVEIINEDRLPDEYVETVVVRKPKKNEIKKAIKGGSFIAGAAIYKRRNLQVK